MSIQLKNIRRYGRALFEAKAIEIDDRYDDDKPAHHPGHKNYDRQYWSLLFLKSTYNQFYPQF